MRCPEPRIRADAASYRCYEWRAAKTEVLPTPQALHLGETRRSCRRYSAPSLQNLSTLLWHAARCQETLPSGFGFDLQLRPVPSAGAIHPIHVLLEYPGSHAWVRYDPLVHRLEHISQAQLLTPLRAAARDYVDPMEGILVSFVAEPGMTAAKYENPESLVWRDAGVLQGALTLLAPQAGLGCCLLGLTGDAWISELGDQGQLIGVGTMILGTPL